ncbi:MAG: response regulator transcription factor [Candidatus Competibacter sp.]|nr:response regulator transcription factor [Candidatus Competibacter sp.]
MIRPISIVLVDDHALVRDMLRQRLTQETDMVVLSCENNAQDAVRCCVATCPDVVLLDIDMPGLSAFEGARSIKSQCSGTRLIFLSAFFHDRYIDQALALEAMGYLTKNEPPEVVIQAIRQVMTGTVYFSDEVLARIVINGDGARLAHAPESRTRLLTERELEMLAYIARGLSKKEIARTVGISVKTVEQHCTHLMEKLAIHDRVELAHLAIREGLVEP